MYFKDFRDYLCNLEKQGMLLRVNRQVSPHFEMAAGIYKTGEINGPALLFENVKGYPGWKVAGGLFVTKKLLAFALQTKTNQLLERYLEFGQNLLDPVPVSSGPVKETIIKGDDIDLTILPFLTYSEEDKLPYHHAGVQVAKHPSTGVHNCSVHRMSVLGKDRMGLYLSRSGHLGLMIKASEERGEGLEVATVVAPHPALCIASGIRAPIGVDEMKIAGAIRGRPFEVVKGETIDVNVSADAEIVIEGVTVPGGRVIEGPWGGPRGNYICHGSQYVMTEKGKPVSEVDGHAVIGMHKRNEVTPQDIIYGVLDQVGTKCVVVVDDDINIYDPIEVEWAIATRVEPEKDLIIMPSANGLPTLGQWGIDATAPLTGEPYGEHWLYKKARPPGINEVNYI
jgi:3-polyprenyl-4-hydroxybenzoate decarboxylase